MKFAGFISYSWADSQIATRFHRSLERFRVPKDIQARGIGTPGIGRYPGKFFIDKEELISTPSLTSDIQEALKASKNLIVLCSPDAARARWVNLEIQYFRELGRSNQIIPVLLRGKPEIFDSVECPDGAFPPSLITPSDEPGDLPFAPSLVRSTASKKSDVDFNRALIQVLARVLSVEHEDLSQRHQEFLTKQLKRQRLLSAALGSMLVASLLSGAIAWNQKRNADLNLVKAITSAAKQVDLASTFEDRYGISNSLRLELLEGAKTDFEVLKATANSHPSFLLQRGKFALAMGQLASQDSGSVISAADLIDRAKADFSASENQASSFMVPLRFLEIPNDADYLSAKVRLASFTAASAMRSDDQEQSDQALQEIGNLITELEAHREEDEASVDLAVATCGIGDVAYALGQRKNGLQKYEDCLSILSQIMEDDPSIELSKTIIESQIAYGNLLRLEAHSVPEALTVHQAAYQTTKGWRTLNDTATKSELSIAANAAASFADTRNIASHPLDEQRELYTEALRYLEQLILMDANRKDWLIQKFAIQYRLVGLDGRELNDDLRLEDQVEAIISDIDPVVEELFRLVGKFPSDRAMRLSLFAFVETRLQLQSLLLTETSTGSELPGLEGKIQTDLSVLFELSDSSQLRQEPRETQLITRKLRATAHMVSAEMSRLLGEEDTTILQEIDTAISIFESYSDERDMQPDVWRDIALAHFRKANIYFRSSDYDSALDSILLSRTIIEDATISDEGYRNAEADLASVNAMIDTIQSQAN